MDLAKVVTRPAASGVTDRKICFDKRGNAFITISDFIRFYSLSLLTDNLEL